MTAYQTFLAGLALRHFAASEVAFLGASNARHGNNHEPPEDLWSNILPALWAADHARAALGKPIRIISAYRSPEYNADISGAPHSLHKKNAALDLAPVGFSPRELHSLLLSWRGADLFTGGLGLYPTFVHVDTRSQNADW